MTEMQIEAARDEVIRQIYPPEDNEPWEEMDPDIRAIWLSAARAALTAALGVKT